MLIALDTSTAWCSAGISAADIAGVNQPIQTISRYLGTGHSAHLLTMIDELLGQRDTPFSAITSIVVTVGPGSFTGLRIACGVAQGLALGSDLSIVPLSTLEVIAQRFVGQNCPIVVCLDARMDELYCAVFNASGLRLCEDFVAGPVQVSTQVIALLEAQLPDALTVHSTIKFNAVGNGWALHATQQTAMYGLINLCDDQAYPKPADMLQLGMRQLAGLDGHRGTNQSQRFAAENAIPAYVRNQVALDMAQQRQLREANEQVRQHQIVQDRAQGVHE